MVPDHYVYRMLYSQDISLEQLGVGAASLENPRRVWRIFAEHYYLFRGTPTRLWLDFAFHELFGLDARLTAENADVYYDVIVEKLKARNFVLARSTSNSGLRFWRLRIRHSIPLRITPPSANRPSKGALFRRFGLTRWSTPTFQTL